MIYRLPHYLSYKQLLLWESAAWQNQRDLEQYLTIKSGVYYKYKNQSLIL